MCLNFEQNDKLSNATLVEGGWLGDIYIPKKNKEVVSTP